MVSTKKIEKELQENARNRVKNVDKIKDLLKSIFFLEISNLK